MDDLVKVKCPRCDETVKCYITNDKKLLFKFGLATVWCPKCKQNLNNSTKIDDSLIALVFTSAIGKVLILFSIALIFLFVMFVI